jgi:hypothetical protein
MVTLPPLEDASLRSFVFILGPLCGASVALLSWSWGLSRPFALGMLTAIAWIVPALLAPTFARFSYRVWNRIAFEFARVARIFIAGICFYVIMVAVGRAGSAIRLRPPESGESMWVPRSTLAADAYRAQAAEPAEGAQTTSWASSYIAWAVKRGNFWYCVMLPFLMLLSALDAPREETVPTDVYTLY